MDEISRTREQLADSTHEKANNTDSDHPGGTADLEDELQELRGDYNQVLSQQVPILTSILSIVFCRFGTIFLDGLAPGRPSAGRSIALTKRCEWEDGANES